MQPLKASNNISGPGVGIKLARAQRHLQELEDAVRAHLEAKPFLVTRHEEPDGSLLYRLRIRSEVPAEWGAIVGDVVHNIRAALDLLAWQFVIASGAQPTVDTAFPITRHRSNFEKTLRRTLSGASEPVRRFVRRLRPYPGGHSILVQLHALDIIDKHRVILVVGAAYKNVALPMRLRVPWQEEPIEIPPFAINPAHRQFPLRDGAQLFRVSPQARSAQLHDEPQFTFEICLGDTDEVQGKPLPSTLASMLAHVQRIVAVAQRFLLRPDERRRSP